MADFQSEFLTEVASTRDGTRKLEVDALVVKHERAFNDDFEYENWTIRPQGAIFSSSGRSAVPPHACGKGKGR